VAFYTMLGIWRMRRSALYNARLAELKLAPEIPQPAPGKNGKVMLISARPDAQPQGK
jgi:hypothetical protein